MRLEMSTPGKAEAVSCSKGWHYPECLLPVAVRCDLPGMDFPASAKPSSSPSFPLFPHPLCEWLTYFFALRFLRFIRARKEKYQRFVLERQHSWLWRRWRFQSPFCHQLPVWHRVCHTLSRAQFPYLCRKSAEIRLGGIGSQALVLHSFILR